MAYSQSGNIVTQSATDSAIPATTNGVNGVSLGDANLLIFGSNMLRINGQLTLNGFLNTLFFDNESDTATNDNERNHDIEVNGTLTIDVSNVLAGEKVYSNKTIYLSRRPSPSGGGGAHVLNTSGSSFAVLNGGTANLTGGYYEVSHNFAVDTGGTMNAEGVHFKTGGSKRFWMNNGSITSFVNCTIENFAPFFNEFPSAVENVTFVNCSAITKEKPWTNGLEATPNIILSPKWTASNNKIIQIWAGAWLRVKNSSGGSSLGIFNNPGANQIIYGICDFTQEAQFRINDTTGEAVNQYKLYAIESDNEDRKDEVSNVADGTRYDNTDVRELNWITDATGVTNTIEARLLAGSRVRNGSNNYSLTRFSNTDADEYQVSGYRYGYEFFTKTYKFNADGILEISEVALVDASITEPSRGLVELYPIALDRDTNGNWTVTGDEATIQQLSARQLYDAVCLYLDNNFKVVDYRVERIGETIDLKAVNITLSYIEFEGTLVTQGSVILQDESTTSQAFIDSTQDTTLSEISGARFWVYQTESDRASETNALASNILSYATVLSSLSSSTVYVSAEFGNTRLPFTVDLQLGANSFDAGLAGLILKLETPIIETRSITELINQQTAG